MELHGQPSSISNMDQKRIILNTNGCCYFCGHKPPSPATNTITGFPAADPFNTGSPDREQGEATLCKFVDLREVLHCLRINPADYNMAYGNSRCYNVTTETFVQLCKNCQLLVEKTSAAYRQVKDGMQEMHSVLATTAGLFQTLEFRGENCGDNAKDVARQLRKSMIGSVATFPRNERIPFPRSSGSQANLFSMGSSTSATVSGAGVITTSTTGINPIQVSSGHLLAVFNSQYKENDAGMYQCPQCKMELVLWLHLKCHVFKCHLYQMLAPAKLSWLSIQEFNDCCSVMKDKIFPSLIKSCGEDWCANVYCDICHSLECDSTQCQHHIVQEHFSLVCDDLQEIQRHVFPQLASGGKRGTEATAMEFDEQQGEEDTTVTSLRALNLETTENN